MNVLHLGLRNWRVPVGIMLLVELLMPAASSGIAASQRHAQCGRFGGIPNCRHGHRHHGCAFRRLACTGLPGYLGSQCPAGCAAGKLGRGRGRTRVASRQSRVSKLGDIVSGATREGGRRQTAMAFRDISATFAPGESTDKHSANPEKSRASGPRRRPWPCDQPAHAAQSSQRTNARAWRWVSPEGGVPITSASPRDPRRTERNSKSAKSF